MSPQSFTSGDVTESTVFLQWEPVDFTANPGGYIISYSTASGGPYTIFDTAAGKSTTQMTVDGLELDNSYYFVVQSYTDQHAYNQNTVISDYSEEVMSATVFDADSDGMSNDWEISYFGNISRDGSGDYDNDGLSDLDEYLNETDPELEDTDSDGITDCWEVKYSLNPLIDDAADDPDGDGLVNLEEYQNDSNPHIVNISQSEREALLALYNSTGGDNWTNNTGWKSGDLHTDGFALPGSECEWYGIYCNSDGDSITSISLNDNNVIGPIPSELGRLTNLTSLSLRTNQLSGSIPAELGDLINLISLELYSNQLTGAIPPELGNLIYLEGLYLYGNQLTGAIPSELGNMHHLISLSLEDNQLSGAIPAELGSLISLEYLVLYGNQLEGAIPVELVNLTRLKWLDLDCNQLSGYIPAELGELNNLEYLSLIANHLTGAIPAEIGDLNNLDALYLKGNQLAGEIPPELLNLSNLTSLSLDYNALYTDDEALVIFIDTYNLSSNWQNTQTIAPENVTIQGITGSSVIVEWTPLTYYLNPDGGYAVSYSLEKDGPYTYFGTTADKSISQMEVTGLAPDTVYYFVIQTQTNPHSNNQNTVLSINSNEDTATTLSAPQLMSLSDSWNLISINNVSTEKSVKSVLRSIADEYVSVWAFDDGKWLIYDPANPDFSDLQEMVPGKGYWINMNNSFDVTVSGISVSDTVELSEGWNLVGYNSTLPKATSDVIASIADNVISVWAYKDEKWIVYDPANPDFSDLTTMEPGYGYWFNMKAQCSWEH